MSKQPSDRTLLFHINQAWSQVNYQLFDQALREPSFSLLEGDGTLGQWNPTRRVISLQRELVYKSSWLEVVEVLKHEMAHQYISEVLKIEGESAHGPSFKRICHERGIVASARGELRLDPEVEKLLNKVNKLLALAESDNSYEAEQAAQRAQQLLVKHHIKLGSELGGLDPLSLESLSESMNFRQLGEPKARHYQYEYCIAQLLSEHFFVSVIWVIGFSVKTGSQGRVLEVCGRHEDLEIAAYVYDFINNHIDLAWRLYKAQSGAKGLRKRLSFNLGLVQGFISQLESQRRESDLASMEMIHIGNAMTQAFTERRYPKTKSSSSSGWSPTRDYNSGYQEGSSLRLRKGVHDKGTRGPTRRLTSET